MIGQRFVVWFGVEAGPLGPKVFEKLVDARAYGKHQKDIDTGEIFLVDNCRDSHAAVAALKMGAARFLEPISPPISDEDYKKKDFESGNALRRKVPTLCLSC